MRCRERSKKPGDVYPVSDSYHYPLPRGLKEGTMVKLIHFDHGYWTVEAEGQQFLVFQTLVDAGLEHEVQGRWVRFTQGLQEHKGGANRILGD